MPVDEGHFDDIHRRSRRLDCSRQQRSKHALESMYIDDPAAPRMAKRARNEINCNACVTNLRMNRVLGSKPGRSSAIVLILTLSSLAGCNSASRPSKFDVRASSAQITLGKRLYSDAQLSRDGSVSCNSCHRRDKAFTDGRSVSIGINAVAGTRNAPSLLDVSTMRRFFWDGREQRLETVVLQPFSNPVEMGLASTQAVVTKLEGSPAYTAAFAQAFPDRPIVTAEHIAIALTAFLHSISTGRNAYDRYRPGNKSSLNMDQRAGLEVFAGKGECNACHRLGGNPATLTDNEFHHLGVGEASLADGIKKLSQLAPSGTTGLGAIVLGESDIAELGRFAVTRKPIDLAAFRTPSLRNVAVTGPYMHNGSVATLEDAVDQEVYYRSLSKGRPLSLTVDERRQLITFLGALTIQPDELK